MTMGIGSARRVVLGLAVGATTMMALGPTPAQAQVRERDVKVTGPRGRTLERSFESVRGPNGLTREMTIQRPAGTLHREVQVQRSPGFTAGPLPGPRHGFPMGGPPRPGFIERDVIVRGGGGPNPLATLGIGAALGTGAGLLLGSALAAPRPAPVVVAPVAPAYVAAPTVVGPAPSVVVAPQPPVQIVQPVVTAPAGPDPVALEIARFQSWHENSRRDAALTLGRMRDPRAIPALVDRLKNDRGVPVRIAAATALGDIGDPQAAVYLERSVTYEKREEVRSAAAASLARLRQIAEAQAAQAQAQAAQIQAQRDAEARAASANPFRRNENVPPPPTPASEIR